MRAVPQSLNPFLYIPKLTDLHYDIITCTVILQWSANFLSKSVENKYSFSVIIFFMKDKLSSC